MEDLYSTVSERDRNEWEEVLMMPGWKFGATATLANMDQMKFVLVSALQVILQVITRSFIVEELLVVEDIVLGWICSQMFNTGLRY